MQLRFVIMPNAKRSQRDQFHNVVGFVDRTMVVGIVWELIFAFI